MAALLPEAGQNFAVMMPGQNDLDAGFDAFMDEEYDEDKIGDLYGEEIEVETKPDLDENKLIGEAVNEFIDNTKQRFLGLAQTYGDENATKLFPDTMASNLIYEGDLKDGEEPEEIKEKLRQKKLALAA